MHTMTAPSARQLNRESDRIMRWNALWDEFDALVELANLTIIPGWAQVALTVENERSEEALDLWNEASTILDRLTVRLEMLDESGQFPPRGMLTEARDAIERVWA